ncbi:MAG TPA: right-handed parallel beta-helix repeat-containing protein [Nitrososphaeraceae archaeon]|nr:right-handed parallel beta-helix repeat-containing protein [Nitrososphaeraceae archaeon]
MKTQKNIMSLFAIYLSCFTLAIMLTSIPSPASAETSSSSCVSYDSQENQIYISCKYVDFKDVANNLPDQDILYPESSNLNEKNWILNAGITVNKGATLNIDADDVTWLKIVPGVVNPNAIKVDGSLKVDSVKITSWNTKTNDYVHFSEATKYDELQYMKELRPYIKVNSGATGPTIIQNSELAYLGYSCNGCGGISFNGGDYSILKNNDIHHIYKGFYSKGMGYMLIEDNRVYNNNKYGIDPHSGTHHMLILNNTVYDNFNAGIICSADCHSLLIEGNTVFNNGHGDNMRGIAVSRNVANTIIQNNIVYNEDKCVSIGRNSYDNHIYENSLSQCIYGVYITKDSANNKIHDNNIETVGIGLAAASNSNDNIFYSNIVTDVKLQPTWQDATSSGNKFDNNNNKPIISFDTLQKKEVN